MSVLKKNINFMFHRVYFKNILFQTNFKIVKRKYNKQMFPNYRPKLLNSKETKLYSNRKFSLKCLNLLDKRTIQLHILNSDISVKTL